MTARGLGALITLASLWGASFMFIRIASPVLGPVMLVTLRVFLAGVALLAYSYLTGGPPLFHAGWRRYLVLGALNAAVPFALMAWAALYLPASLLSILNASVPLSTAVVAAFSMGERLTWTKMTGLIIGLMGVSIVVGWNPTALTPLIALAAGAVLLAAFFYGMGSVYSRVAFDGDSPLSLATGQQLFAAALLAPAALVQVPGTWPSLPVVAAVVGLALLCTSAAYLLYFYLIRTVGPVKTMTVTYLIPMFGTLWGWLVLGERIEPATLLGFAVILLGVSLVSGVHLGMRRDRTAWLQPGRCSRRLFQKGRALPPPN